MGIGHYALNPAARQFGRATEGDIFNNTGGENTYTNMRQNANSNPEWWENAGDDVSTINPNDEYNIREDASDVRNLSQIRDIMRRNGASRNDIGQINEAIKTAQNNGGSLAADRNPQMAEVLAKIKAGEYGQEVKDIYTNRSGNMRGMNTRAKSAEAVESKQANINANRNRGFAAGARAVGGAVQILQPFIGAYYSERAVRLGAELFDEDASNSINVSATMI